MKRLLFVAALLPFAAFAQPLNTTNNPNQPGYVIPSQQRMETRMLNQQQQQQGMLNQQLQTQARQQQQHLQTQLNNDAQRVRQAQPGELDPSRQQLLPNTNGGMLSQGIGNGGRVNMQQHMLPQNQNGNQLSNGTNNADTGTQQHMLPQNQNGGLLRDTPSSTTP
ncbi:DUF2756 family protein [Kosakonia sp. WA-90]|uniref:DUF2756 family protein n=1 Tax=Kosakonia sp. WA-90 TaxID=3153576 RepID=UPI00325D8490